MTQEDEKQLILLSAILMSGGGGTKQTVLDAVDGSGLMAFTPNDVKMLRTRNELTWRNDLAFVRSHLVKNGCIANRQDSWDITPRGRERATELAKMAEGQEKLKKLNKAALPAIMRILAPHEAQLSDDSAVSGETEWLEGAQSLRWTTTYERNGDLRREAIRIHGLVCKGCGFDFEKTYGVLGKGFIEVHHLNPISEQGGIAAVAPLTDLTVLCSNCHSIVHRNKPKPLTLIDLMEVLMAARG